MCTTATWDWWVLLHMQEALLTGIGNIQQEINFIQNIGIWCSNALPKTPVLELLILAKPLLTVASDIRQMNTQDEAALWHQHMAVSSKRWKFLCLTWSLRIFLWSHTACTLKAGNSFRQHQPSKFLKRSIGKRHPSTAAHAFGNPATLLNPSTIPVQSSEPFGRKIEAEK